MNLRATLVRRSAFVFGAVALLWTPGSPTDALAQEVAPAPAPAPTPTVATEPAPPVLEGVLDGVSSIEEVSIEDLLNAQVEVVSRKLETLRETPGVVTVLTREEILASGARDLLEALSLVPGLVPYGDVQGADNFAFRGINAGEGKALLIVDGMMVNDMLYNNLEIGNRFPAEIIESVEIIRGPGSVLYGGFAELTVVNVKTRSGQFTPGAFASVTYGQFEGSLARALVSAGYADKIEALGGLELSASVSIGQAQRSEFDYTDFNGATFDQAESAQFRPLLLNAGARWRGFNLRLIFDDFHQRIRDTYDGSTAEPYDQSYRSLFAAAGHETELGERVTLTSRLSYLRQQPWRVEDMALVDNGGAGLFYMKTAERFSGGVHATWILNDHLDALVGLEGNLDHGHADSTTEVGFQTLFDGETDVWYQSAAAFAQLTGAHELLGKLTVGARYEQHNEYGGAFVPRAAYTRTFGPFHVKALASQAFRTPSLENINLQLSTIEPERTTVFELEAGYQWNDQLLFTANAFDIGIDEPIVYVYDEVNSTEGYENYKGTGSRGIELETRLRLPRVWANASYAFYTSAGKNEVETYAIPGQDDQVLGLPKHKVVLQGSARLWRNLRLNPTVVFWSERWGYVTSSDTPEKLSADVMASLFLSYRDLGMKGLTASLGAHNLFNEEHRLVQVYQGSHPPFPSPSREYMLRLIWEP